MSFITKMPKSNDTKPKKMPKSNNKKPEANGGAGQTGPWRRRLRAGGWPPDQAAAADHRA